MTELNKPKFKNLIIIFLSIFLFIFSNRQTFAQQEEISTKYYEGKIIEVIEEKQLEFPEQQLTQTYQKLKVEITKGERKGEIVEIENGTIPQSHSNTYEKGNRVLISSQPDMEGNEVFYITDFIRSNTLSTLFIMFIIPALIVGGKKGFFSLISMALSFIIIFIFLLPQINTGKDPIIIAIIASLVIIPITFYLSHGFEKKTTISILGTLIALTITGILSIIFVNLTKLTGGALEEALFLQGTNGQSFNLRGLLLAGIIIGTLGIMDDITISQTSIVYQLHDLKKDIPIKELFSRSMQLGKDHIASMINTLILVYTGAAMPLLLLFLNESRTFGEIISLEPVATEIVRTLVGSIGLILAVPITTYLACLTVKKKNV